MKPAAFDYCRPETVEEALDVLFETGDEAVLLAGGMSLGPMLNLRLIQPALVIDIGRIEGLEACELGAQNVSTGALLRQSTAMSRPDVMAAVPLLALALPWVGHVQTRNRGNTWRFQSRMLIQAPKFPYRWSP